MTTKKSSTKKDDRTRNWTCILYPTKEQLAAIGSDYDGSDGYGSLPDNWRDILDEEHIQWIESPLHDKDTNPDKTKKKPHWHIVLLFEGNKSYEQVKDIIDKLNAPTPQKCASVKGTVRYMAHLDHGDKFQYDKASIIGHGGADVAEYLKPTSSSRYQLIGEMRQWVNENNCVEFCDLMDYAYQEHPDDWVPMLCDNSTYVMGEYIKSRRNKKYWQIYSNLDREDRRRFDPKTGEIL